MRSTRRRTPFLVALLLVSAAPPLTAAVPPVPPTPAPIAEVLYARPFSLERAFTYDWRQERPEVDSGLLLVLAVEPDLVYPRAVEEPVLYIGGETAWRLNVGYRSGRVVALVPGDVDLATAPIWFGTPALPEQVSAADAVRELALARAAGIRPLPVAEALERGGEPLARPHLAALLADAAELVREYSPAEASRAEILASQVP